MLSKLRLVCLCLVVVTAVSAAGCSQRGSANQPSMVTIDAGAPLQCTLLPTPKQIQTITATYSCAAPGAYLESVDTKALTAQYFTTDSQGVSVTYGPVEKPILEVSP